MFCEEETEKINNSKHKHKAKFVKARNEESKGRILYKSFVADQKNEESMGYSIGEVEYKFKKKNSL